MRPFSPSDKRGLGLRKIGSLMANASGETIVLKTGLSRAAQLGKLAAQLRKHQRMYIGAIVLFTLVIMALTADLWVHYDPIETDFLGALKLPGREHWLGTDRLGRDVFARVVYSARVSLFIGLAAVAWSASLGVTTGILAGYFGGRIDYILMRVVDAFMAFPSFILAMVLTYALGPSLINIAVALAITSGPGFARVIRSQILSIRERDYIIAAHAIGASGFRIMSRHLFPHVVTLLVVNASLALGSIIFAESSLAFLGLGVAPPTPTWGSMMREGMDYLERAPLLSLAPGAAVTLAVLGFNFVGDGLRDLLDPLTRNVKKG